MWGDLGPKPVASEGEKPKRTVEEVLHDAVRQSIEGMAFMPVLPSDVLCATVGVLEPAEGELLIVLSEPVAQNLTASVQGCDSDAVTDQMVSDFVAELANLIAGQLLSMLLPEDQLFELGLPSVSTDGLRTHTENACSAFFTVDGSPFEVEVSGAGLVALLFGAGA